MKSRDTPGSWGRAVYRLGGYSEYAAPVGLGGCVEPLWSFGSSGNKALPHRVIPNGGVSLCFRHMLDRDGDVVRPHLVLIGPVYAPRIFDPEPSLAMEVVQLKPEWVQAILGSDPRDHVGKLDAWAAGTPLVANRLLDAMVSSTRNTGSAFPTLLDWIEDRARAVRPDRPTRLANEALDMVLGRSGGDMSGVLTTARQLGVSPRHIQRVVKATAGARPKYLQRVHRLNRAVSDADRVSQPRWAMLSAQHGYCDQAHFISECRSLAKCTPSALHAERRAEDVAFLQSRSAETP